MNSEPVYAFLDCGGLSHEIVYRGRIYYVEILRGCGLAFCNRDGGERKSTVPRAVWDAAARNVRNGKWVGPERVDLDAEGTNVVRLR